MFPTAIFIKDEVFPVAFKERCPCSFSFADLKRETNKITLHIDKSRYQVPTEKQLKYLFAALALDLLMVQEDHVDKYYNGYSKIMVKQENVLWDELIESCSAGGCTETGLDEPIAISERSQFDNNGAALWNGGIQTSIYARHHLKFMTLENSPGRHASLISWANSDCGEIAIQPRCRSVSPGRCGTSYRGSMRKLKGTVHAFLAASIIDGVLFQQEWVQLYKQISDNSIPRQFETTNVRFRFLMQTRGFTMNLVPYTTEAGEQPPYKTFSWLDEYASALTYETGAVVKLIHKTDDKTVETVLTDVYYQIEFDDGHRSFKLKTLDGGSEFELQENGINAYKVSFDHLAVETATPNTSST